jgi:hypothetical protein
VHTGEGEPKESQARERTAAATVALTTLRFASAENSASNQPFLSSFAHTRNPPKASSFHAAAAAEHHHGDSEVVRGRKEAAKDFFPSSLHFVAHQAAATATTAAVVGLLEARESRARADYPAVGRRKGSFLPFSIVFATMGGLFGMSVFLELPQMDICECCEFQYLRELIAASASSPERAITVSPEKRN